VIAAPVFRTGWKIGKLQPRVRLDSVHRAAHDFAADTDSDELIGEVRALVSCIHEQGSDRPGVIRAPPRSRRARIRGASPGG
jgi:hypothetical protein